MGLNWLCDLTPHLKLLEMQEISVDDLKHEDVVSSDFSTLPLIPVISPFTLSEGMEFILFTVCLVSDT